MHAAHTGTALFLAFRVRDQSVHADPVAAKVPFKNDGVEIFLDGDRVPNDLTGVTTPGNLEGFQIVADVLGNRLSAPSTLGDTSRGKPARTAPTTGMSSNSRSRWN